MSSEKEISHIRDLVPDAANRRKHTPRNVGMIVDSLQKVGAGRSIVIDEKNEILAGNATIEAAAEAGITKIKVVDTDGETIIAVRRRGLSAQQKRALAIYDNRTAEMAEWDVGQLLKDMKAGEDLSAFFREDEVAALLGDDAPINLGDGDIEEKADMQKITVFVPHDHAQSLRLAIRELVEPIGGSIVN